MVILHKYYSDERAISYASQTLNKSERNYAQIEPEALSLIFGVTKFHDILYGRKFTLVTDHNPLLAILGPTSEVPTMAAARMQRWALLLSAYDYNIEYRNSDSNSNCDALLRFGEGWVRSVLPFLIQSDNYCWSVDFWKLNVLTLVTYLHWSMILTYSRATILAPIPVQTEISEPCRPVFRTRRGTSAGRRIIRAILCVTRKKYNNNNKKADGDKHQNVCSEY